MGSALPVGRKKKKQKQRVGLKQNTGSVKWIKYTNRIVVRHVYDEKLKKGVK
jgi:hypothetical protein